MHGIFTKRNTNHSGKKNYCQRKITFKICNLFHIPSFKNKNAIIWNFIFRMHFQFFWKRREGREGPLQSKNGRIVEIVLIKFRGNGSRTYLPSSRLNNLNCIVIFEQWKFIKIIVSNQLWVVPNKRSWF